MTGLLSGLQESLERLPERIISTAWDTTAGRLLDLLLTVVGVLVSLVGRFAGGMFSGVNFFSQIPEPWVTLVALEGLRGRLAPIAFRVAGLAVTLIIVRWIAGGIFDWPFPGWSFALVKILAVTPVVAAAPVAMLAIIRAGNALSASLFDPSQGLPGLSGAGMLDEAAGSGIATLFYLAVCFWLWWVRLQIVVAALLLFVTSPLAVAAWVLPFNTCLWVARAWLTTFLGVVAVQVLMSLTLGLGGALLASNVVGGGVEGAPSGLVNLLLAAGLVGATCWLPRRILGALLMATPPGSGLLRQGMQLGMVLAGAGGVPAVAGTALSTMVLRRGAAPPPHATVSAVSPTGAAPSGAPPSSPSSGRIGSLLGGQRRMALPPPRE